MAAKSQTPEPTRLAGLRRALAKWPSTTMEGHYHPHHDGGGWVMADESNGKGNSMGSRILDRLVREFLAGKWTAAEAGRILVAVADDAWRRHAAERADDGQ